MSETPETDEIRAAYENQRESVGGIIEHAEELEKEISKLRKDKERLDWIFENCKIVHFPDNGEYPIEHNQSHGKKSRELFEKAIDDAKSTEG